MSHQPWRWGLIFTARNIVLEVNELTLAAMDGHFENKHLDEIVL